MSAARQQTSPTDDALGRRRVTVNTASRMRAQLDYLDLQILSAEIYGNQTLEHRLERERSTIRRLLGLRSRR